MRKATVIALTVPAYKKTFKNGNIVTDIDVRLNPAFADKEFDRLIQEGFIKELHDPERKKNRS